VNRITNSSNKVQLYLEEQGHELKVKTYPASTRTAKDAASAIGCEVGQIAKSLIFKEPEANKAVLIIASGSNLVDLDKVQKATGLTLGKADADFVREQTGYAIGGVPPVAHKQPLQTLLDNDLIQYPTIWAAAGTPNTVFELTSSDLLQLTKGTWLNLKQ
jgi:prolyl-tRNA editing enzyme YbaK/EbsC (Cys-tRNA(Pro) deacylase)